MNIFQFGSLGLCACSIIRSASAMAAFLPEENFLETGVVIVKQEAIGLRLSAGWVMSLGVPSFVSRIGLELGTHFYDKANVPDYGFFLESTLHAAAAYSVYFKTAVHTLDFPDSKATVNSMSTLEFEPGVRWVLDSGVWALGLGLRHRNESERIVLGSDVIERKWLLYPILSWFWRF